MMRKILLAAAAAMALSACGQLLGGGNGPALPTVQEGAQAPSTQARPTGQVQRAQIDDATRTQLIANIGEQLGAISQNFAAGMAPPAGATDQIVALEPSTDHRWTIDLAANKVLNFGLTGILVFFLALMAASNMAAYEAQGAFDAALSQRR